MSARKRKNELDLKERLRRTLSYREKSLREAAGAVEEAERFAAASHAREAARLLPGLRDEISREASRLGGELQRALAEQSRLVAGVADGRMRAAKANRLNRRLVARMEACRARLAQLNSSMNADSSSELGGFVDLPLPEYARAIKKKPQRVTLRPTSMQFALWVAMVAAAVLGSLYYLDYFKTVLPVALEVGEIDTTTGAVHVMCRNDSDKPILLYVPWHGPAVTEASSTRLSGFGLAVYVRERGSREFRLFPISVSAWTYQGRTMQEGGPIEIAPRLYVNLVLDEPHALDGIQADAIRVALLDMKGRPLVRHQVSLTR